MGNIERQGFLKCLVLVWSRILWQFTDRKLSVDNQFFASRLFDYLVQIAFELLYGNISLLEYLFLDFNYELKCLHNKTKVSVMSSIISCYRKCEKFSSQWINFAKLICLSFFSMELQYFNFHVGIPCDILEGVECNRWKK